MAILTSDCAPGSHKSNPHLGSLPKGDEDGAGPHRRVESTREPGGSATAGPGCMLDNIGQIYKTNNQLTCPFDGKPCDHAVCLDNGSDSYCPRSTRRKKAKARAYWAITSANSWYKFKSTWWLTLTNTPGSQPVQKSWNHLRTIIGQTTRQDIINWSFDEKRPSYSAKESRMVRDRYQGLNLKEPLDFQYIAIRTSEGYGVYHMFVYGDMLPASWLRHHWKRITDGASQLRVERVKEMEPVKRYALSQYALGQDQFVRCSHSQDLIFANARPIWKAMVAKFGYDQALPYWKYCMMVNGYPYQVHDDLDQATLDGSLMLGLKENYRLVSMIEAQTYYSQLRQQNDKPGGESDA